MFRELAYKVQTTLGRIHPQRALNLPPASGSSPRGRALVSYLPLPLIGDPGLFRGTPISGNVRKSSVFLIAWDMRSIL